MGSRATQSEVAASSRNTVQRALVLEAVQALCGSHPTSADVYRVVREQHPSISRATVYRNLGVLVERGSVLRVEVPGAADCYDACVDPHYHAVCRLCGGVVDVDVPYQHDLVSQVESASGFTVERHDIIFAGICEGCRREGKGA